MKEILLLKETDAEYISKLVREHFLTYSNNRFVSSIYLSAYSDEKTSAPTIEMTLVADWFKSYNAPKTVMGYFLCPKESEEKDYLAPMYVLSMADVKKYKRVSEDGASSEDQDVLDDLQKSSCILLDKDGICSKILSFDKNGFDSNNGRAKTIQSFYQG